MSWWCHVPPWISSFIFMGLFVNLFEIFCVTMAGIWKMKRTMFYPRHYHDCRWGFPVTGWSFILYQDWNSCLSALFSVSWNIANWRESPKTYRWLSARKTQVQCVGNRVTSTLHLPHRCVHVKQLYLYLCRKNYIHIPLPRSNCHGI